MVFNNPELYQAGKTIAKRSFAVITLYHMKTRFFLLWMLIAIGFPATTIAQEYFESFYGEEVNYPAYSEYYQDYSSENNSKAFIANYRGEIIQFEAGDQLKTIDTLRLGTGYPKAFDYEVFGRNKEELIVTTTSNKEVILYSISQQTVLFETEVKYLLNDIQFSNINSQIIWGADKRGNLAKIDLNEKTISYHPIHSKGIARIELFMDKIITSSFDHTIKVTNQLTLEEEQTIKFQVPPLEYDVSCDGIIAVAAAYGVALYSIPDQKWLYGQELTKKKSKLYKEDTKKYYWNPYVNDDDYLVGGSTSKITFVRKSHLITTIDRNTELRITHVRNPELLVYPYTGDTISTYSPRYIFNQDNHLSFLNDEIKMAEETGEEAPHILTPKSNYIKKIDEYGVSMSGNPFNDYSWERFDFANSDIYDNNYPFRTGFNFISMDDFDTYNDSSYTSSLNLTKYNINHGIYFPSSIIDTVEYRDISLSYLPLSEMEDCITDNEEMDISVMCVLELSWVKVENSVKFLQYNDQYALMNSYDFNHDISISSQKVQQGVLNSAIEYQNGLPEEIEQSEPEVILNSSLYADNVFERMDQKGHLSKVEAFAISPNQKYLATSGQDAKIIIWDFYTGTKLKELDYANQADLNKSWIWYESEWDYGITQLLFHPTKSWIIASTRNKNSFCWDYSTGQIIGNGSVFDYGVISEDGNYLIVNGSNIYELPSLKWMDDYEGEVLPESYIHGNKKVIKNLSSGGGFTADYIDRDIDIIADIIDDISSGLEHEFWDYSMMSPSGKWYVIDDILFDADNNECWNLEDYVIDDYRYIPIYDNGAFSSDESQFAYIAGKQLKIVDLTTMKTETIVDTTVYKFATPLQFSPNGKYVVTKVWEIMGGELNWLDEANSNRTLGIYDTENLNKLRHHYGHPVEPMYVNTDSSFRFLVFQGNDFLYLLDQEDLSIDQLKLQQKSKNYHLNFSNIRVIISSEGEPIIQGEIDKAYGNGSYYNDFEWFPTTGEFINYSEGELDINFYESNIMYASNRWQSSLSGDNVLWRYEELIDIYPLTDTNERVHIDTATFGKITDRINLNSKKLSGSFNYSDNFGVAIATSNDLKHVFLPTETHGIAQYELPNMKLVREWEAHGEHVNQIVYLDNNLLTISNDGDIILWDITDDPKEVLRFYGDKSGLFMITPDNYYSATKDNIDFVSFRKGNNFIPISSFDLKYNRPDIILSRINSKDTELIDAYKKAYEKRIKHMNVDPEQLEIENLPSLKIENMDYLPKFTDDDVLEIFVSCEQPLEDAQLWLNGVPQNITFEPTDEGYLLKFSLVNGMNEIEIRGKLAKKGLTLPATYVLEKSFDRQFANNLYILSIGVSEYADATFNLGYAAKDAKDVSEAFSSVETFDTLVRLTLTNDDVTSDALPEIRAFLERATINDVVVIYIAGHGLLDQNFDYYYATHNVDFDHPEENGWSYTLFEELLALSKANKKLLLFDTCHGGEIDKDELAANNEENTNSEDVQFRASKSFNYNTQQSSASTLSKEFFGDFRKGVGATVIASSGGTEYAAESSTFQNGIFTYFLKKGLNENEADLNEDNFITVNELRLYLNEEVRKATNGHQNPGTRIVNDKHQIILKEIVD